MGSFQLPLPPQLPAAAPAPTPQPMATPTQLGPPNQTADIISGINSFVTQFQSSREKEREHNASLAQQSLQNMLLGLPVDMKKTAQYMKKAGMNIDFETPRPAIPPTQAGPPDANGVPAAPSGVGGVSPPPNPNMPQGVWDRIKQSMGGAAPPVNPNSVGMAALQRLQGIGAQNLAGVEKQGQVATGALDVAQAGQGNDMQMAAIMKGAMSGNQGAMEMLARLQNKGQLPSDEMFRVGKIAGMDEPTIAKMMMQSQLGGTKMLELTMELAEKNKDRFGGSLATSARYIQDVLTKGSSDLVPDKLTVEDRLKAANVQKDIMEEHPNLSSNIARAYSLASITPGGEKQANLLADYISKNYPTKGSVAQKQFGQTLGLDTQKFKESQQEFNKSHELAVMNAVRGQLGDEFDKFASILMDSKVDQATHNAAALGLAAAGKKLGTLKVDGVSLNMGTALNAERVTSWTDILHPWSDDKYDLAPSMSPEDITGMLKTPSYITDPAERKWYNEKQVEFLGRHLDATMGDSLMGRLADAGARNVAAQRVIDRSNPASH